MDDLIKRNPAVHGGSIKSIDLSLPTPEENLACDEALLDMYEDEGRDGEILRFWETRQPFVVLGHANRTGDEVHVDACRRNGIPILRRVSGGGAVLQGPGCLNFSLILKTGERAPLSTIRGTNEFVIKCHERALRALLGPAVQARGLSDLAMDVLKFSGNAQRRRGHHVLFHGTFLFDFDIELVERTLTLPARQPAYRRNRPHRDFLANIGVPTRAIKEALQMTWQAHEELTDVPFERIASLRDRYASAAWNFKF